MRPDDREVRAPHEDVVLLTGSAGFIAGHLRNGWVGPRSLLGVDRLPLEVGAGEHLVVDLGDEEAVAAAEVPRRGRVLHLAAEAEVEMPFDRLPDLVDSNLRGTLNVLSHWDPRHMVFTSTAAVYGDGAREGSSPGWEEVRPVGVYGMSKVMGEWACTTRARDNSMSAVVLRLGNVVGEGCRGLIPFLVGHALKYPNGEVAARARGEGRMIRDYVPVEHVVQVIRWGAEADLSPGEVRILNVGSGRPMTNGEVGEVVQRVLAQEEITLAIRWDSPPVVGEANAVVLQVEETLSATGLSRPTREQIESSITQGVRGWLTHLQNKVGEGGRPGSEA